MLTRTFLESLIPTALEGRGNGQGNGQGFGGNFEQAALVLTRVFLVLWAVITLSIFATRVRLRKRWLAIPKGTRIFTVSWTITWAFFPIYTFVNSSATSTEWFRALYGTAYLGMLSGLGWCLWYATKELPEPKVIEQVHDAVVEVVTEELAKSDLLDKRGSAYGGF